MSFEFFDGIDGKHRSGVTCRHDRIHHALRHPRIVAVDAVDEKVVVVRAAAISAVCPARIAGIFRNTRPQVQQVFEVPAVQREIVDHGVRDRSAKFGVVRFH